MSAPVAAAATNILGGAPPSNTPQHSYGTRIRQNSVIKPSARLRQSSDPVVHQRRIRPAISVSKTKLFSEAGPSADLPIFPPSHVVLHEDDSTSKVFLAIGRSFLSVDNRAMTIKDLAEMTMKFGLMCQNVSAAGQAITTYIRNHMQRCEDQQDHPLLLRHVLSGTPSDDELVPALHSRSGGAHCALPSGNNRATNFRRGTMVWYLSRAAGAPCPFTRSGIRLCEYTENGKIGSTAKDPRERKRERDRKRRLEQQQQCGQKRKRLSRACAGGGMDSEESASEAEKRPPKVKLTLRLRPSPSVSSSSPPLSTPPESESSFREIIDLSKDSESEEDDSMSVDSESSDDESTEGSPSPSYYAPSAPDSAYFRMPSPSSFVPSDPRLRRSPSAPHSDASPPPDSEDEDDSFITSIHQLRRHSIGHVQGAPWEDEEEDLEWDEDDDADDESGDTGSYMPSGASTALHDTILVKQEEDDHIGGMLDAWEDLDNGLASMKVMEVVTQAAAMDLDSTKVKIEEVDSWDFDTYGAPSPSAYLHADDDRLNVKEEEDDLVPSLETHSLLSFEAFASPDLICGSPLTPLSAWSPDSEIGEMKWSSLRRPSDLLWKDAELLGPDSILPQELEEGEWDSKMPKQESEFAESSRAPSEAPSLPSATPDSPSADSDDPLEDTPSTPPLLLSSLPPITVATSDLQTSPLVRPVSVDEVEELPKAQDEVVVVHTCEPCTPSISATQLEGISVYQMNLGSSRLLRRIDTDFVNLSPIMNYCNVPTATMRSVPNATFIAQGSPTVCGTWVPLSEAQAFVEKHLPSDARLEVFLSGLLFERFPSALQDFHRSNTRGRLLNKFGSQFQSSAEARRTSRRRVVPLNEVCSPWERGMMSYTDIEDHLLAVHPSLVLPEAPVKRLEDMLVPETPLSPTEQEMFHTLCNLSDWDTPSQDAAPVLVSAESADLPWATEGGDADEDMEKGLEGAAVTRRRSHSRDRPLRRSKRVANATAARTRTRSNKRGARSLVS